MKITMYELLGMIKNGKTPKKIRYNGIFYEFNNKKDNYYENYYENETCSINWDYVSLHCLNDEVEILEEEPRDINVCGSWFTKSEYDELANSEEKKIPEKLFFTHISNYNDQSVVNNNFNNYFKKTQETINQLIDYLKSKGE